jgi:hypothetical protein
MTIEEYAQQMLSCTDPDEVVRIWNEYGKSHTEEQVIVLHKKSGVADKLLWAIKHPDMDWTPNTEQHGCGCVYGKHRCTDRKDGWQKDKDWNYSDFA